MLKKIDELSVKELSVLFDNYPAISQHIQHLEIENLKEYCFNNIYDMYKTNNVDIVYNFDIDNLSSFTFRIEKTNVKVLTTTIEILDKQFDYIDTDVENEIKKECATLLLKGNSYKQIYLHKINVLYNLIFEKAIKDIQNDNNFIKSIFLNCYDITEIVGKSLFKEKYVGSIYVDAESYDIYTLANEL